MICGMDVPSSIVKSPAHILCNPRESFQGSGHEQVENCMRCASCLIWWMSKARGRKGAAWLELLGLRLWVWVKQAQLAF